MRTNVSNRLLPGVQSERTMALGSEHSRYAVFAGGEYAGEIVYVSRRTKAGTEYGWRPAKVAAQSKLSSKVDAIRRLPRVASDAGSASPLMLAGFLPVLLVVIFLAHLAGVVSAAMTS